MRLAYVGTCRVLLAYVGTCRVRFAYVGTRRVRFAYVGTCRVQLAYVRGSIKCVIRLEICHSASREAPALSRKLDV